MKKNMIWIILGTVVVIILVIGVIIMIGKLFMKPYDSHNVETESISYTIADEEERPQYVTYDGYTELIALADTDEQAKEIATLYGIELKRHENGVAVYVTQEDPREVIKRGEENGWPTISLNNIIYIDPIKKGTKMNDLLDGGQ